MMRPMALHDGLARTPDAFVGVEGSEELLEEVAVDD